MTSLWLWIAVVVLLAVAVSLAINLYYFVTTCPRCHYRLYFTDLGMEPHERWVCFHCEYEQRINGINPSLAWLAWHEEGKPYYERPVIGKNGDVREWEKVYFDLRVFERARDKIMKRKS